MSLHVPGEGPTPCDVLLLGEYPGVDEVKWGRPFVGKAGRELTRFLDGVTCPDRADLYLSTLRRTPLPGTDWGLDAQDHDDLWAEIARVRPKVIVTLGQHVTQFFLGDVTLEAVHGIPHTMPVERWLGHHGPPPVVFPAYNPAATLHAPKLQAAFAYDMRRLGLALLGQLPNPPVDDRGQYYYVYTSDVTEPVDPYSHRRPLRTFAGLYGAGDWAVDTEGLPGRPWGLSVSVTPGYGGVVKAADVPTVTARVQSLIDQQAISITLHNALHDLAVLREMGLDLDDLDVPFDDTMVMAYLLGIEPQGLKPLAYRHAGAVHTDYSDVVAEPSARLAETWLADLVAREDVPDKVRTLVVKMLAKGEPETLRTRWAACRSREILTDELGLLDPYAADPPEATLDDVPEAVAVAYAARDADLTLRVRRSLRPQVTAMGLDDVYQTDLAIVPMIDRMQAVGLDVDLPHFTALADMLRVEQAMNAEALRAMTGRDLNPQSGDQVAAYLFDELALHETHPNLRLKYTKSRERLSTNDKVLEALETSHPVVPLIMDGREISKMLGTYAVPIPRLVSRDGRLHPRYRLTRAETGRLTAADPNILALPKHSARGEMVRNGFRAGPGRVLGEWDLSQIEMVIFACDAMDEVMLDAFRRGLDFHRDTASRVFTKAPAQISGEERFAAKAVNFGILMGITAFGLVDQFHKNGQGHYTVADCEALLRDWHRAYPQGSAYINRKHAEARQYGYVRDRWGRLRWLEGVHSYDKYIQEEALRQAQATPTQSGAQGVIKRAMGALWPVLKELRRQGHWVECLLQIHDALVVEYAPEDEALVDAVVMSALCDTVALPIPIGAKATKGVRRLGEL